MLTVHLNMAKSPSTSVSKCALNPKYQMRKVTNRDAVLIVVWNLLVTTVLYYVIYKSQTPEKFCPISFQSLSVPLGIEISYSYSWVPW